ncbi:hypothetical protein V428_16090 [Aeromonas hydrophila subsp. hydrophila AL09-71]|nr:hypothetical protein V428_16090 [Aeromonas hydrophila subsp. hydrophila AL09-71]AHX70328.1 hypothetical protein V429_16125 [Aeromonas hydrophila pc104A]ALQ62702.1 hypothetical protein AS145_07305 [Aeromonas hydrophila]AXV29311.1 hypothetical protein BFW97_07305 [Aeromonas hydrophila]KWR66971.1 hypothetical protein ATO50_12915 [Aeromonas hydrophila]
MKLILFKIYLIDTRDLEFTSFGRLNLFSDINDLIVVEVESGYGKMRLWLCRFLFDRDHTLFFVKFDNTETFRILHFITKYRGTFFSLCSLKQHR